MKKPAPKTPGRAFTFSGHKFSIRYRDRDVQSIFLNEITAGLDLVTHQAREQAVGIRGVVDLHLEQ